MKKKNKFLIFLNALLSAIAIPSLINFFISKFADKSSNKLAVQGEYYSWKYGKIFYTIKGDGMPLLLIHSTGIGCSSLEWTKNVDTLSKSYKVYSIDLLGYGKSEKPNMTYTAYIYSQLIVDFTKEIIQKPVNLVASSLGCAFCTMAYLLSPESFNKMLFICPSGLGNSNTSFDNKNKLINRLIISPIFGTSIYNYMTSRKNIKNFLENNILYNETLITDELISQYYSLAHMKNSKYAFTSFMCGYMNTDIETPLTKLAIPVYVIWGKKTSSISPIDNLNIIKKSKPDIQYAIFDQTKLSPHYEHPREFNKICKEFFC